MKLDSKNAFGWLKGLIGESKKAKRWGATETQTSITIGGDSQDTGSTNGSTSQASAAAEFKPLPLIGHLPLKAQYGIGLGLLTVNLLFAMGCAAFYYTGLGVVTRTVTTATSMQTRIQQIAKNAQPATVGDEKVFPLLVDGQKSFASGLAELKSASSTFDEYQAVKLNREIKKVDSAWKSESKIIDSITTKQTNLVDSSKQTVATREVAGVMVLEMEKLLAYLVQTTNNKEQHELVNYSILLSQRATNTVNELLLSDKVSPDMIVSIREDAKNIKRLVVALDKGDTGLRVSGVKDATTQTLLSSVKRAHAQFDSNLTALMSALGSVYQLKEGAVKLVDTSDVQTANLQTVIDEYSVKQNQVNLRAYVATFFGILGLLSFTVIVLVNTRETRRQALESKQEKNATEAAILRLIDEMGNLADGDLTSRATVTEEVTGAIADSVNFTIGQLAEVVEEIQSSASLIDQATSRARETSNRLLKINEQQTRDITETGRAILQIAEAIEEVSKRMEDSKKVAEQSVLNATRGSDAVMNSIDGIKAIQTNVDETGKRIRRLTEQSQQISEIVDLIADISERTSVLAINATVQATKAGAAGKGFKVVADAVQELANQASEATRRIGALINAIQTDIQGAGAAMLKTTEEAERGAQLAEATGEALAEISDVSSALSDIVAEINEQVGQSAKAAAQVSQTMKKVLDSVGESASSTKETTLAIEEINQLSEKLRDSVSGFKI